MTRSTQKASERQTLDTVLSALGLRSDADPVEGETPDFMLTLSGRRIGVEVTMYRSGDIVEGGSERRQAEAEWGNLLSASDAFRSARLGDVNVGLMFKGPVPLRRLLGAHRHELKTSDTDYWQWDFSTPCMGLFLSRSFSKKFQQTAYLSSFVSFFVRSESPFLRL